MIRSFQWDLARQVERLDWLLAQLPRYADWGYQEVHLHLEDAVEYPSLPGVARRDAYSYRQFARLVEAATRVGIKVVPIVNLLGHTQYLVKVPELRDLNELRAPDGTPLERGQICPLHRRTLEIADALLRDVAPFCTAGKVHIGLDESFHLGRHPLSRREIARIGLAEHFARYVRRLHRLVTREHGLEMSMWADMLYFLPDAVPQLPRGITAYEWYYYPFQRRPRVEFFNFVETDLADRLRAQGLRYYGCPMNGAFRFEPLPHFADRMNNIVDWWRYARKVGAEGFLVSSWEPYRLAIELTTAVDAAAATLWLEPHVTDPREMLARGFERAFGQGKGRAMAKVALACDKFPYAGYARWQTNDRWDVASRREPLSQYRREESHFARLARICAAQRLPSPLRASVEFRRYLAQRDVFLRGGSSRLRVQDGLRAVQTMWKRTRDARVQGPNERIVRGDAQRRPERRGWQLCYKVWNFAPAVQLVGVEQRQPDGSWKTLQQCHTIEFQGRAARRRGGLIREHAAPVNWDADGANPPKLRIFLRGVGQVKVGDVALLDLASGRTVRWHTRNWTLLGNPAPTAGLPAIDWTANSAALELAAKKLLPQGTRSSSSRRQ